MQMSDDELLRKAYLERRDDEITMALAARLETLLDGLEKLTSQTNNLNT